MVLQTLLASTSAPLSLALAPEALDRMVVWTVLVLVISLIAWREYTLPDVSPPLQVSLVEATDPDAVLSHGETRPREGE